MIIPWMFAMACLLLTAAKGREDFVETNQMGMMQTSFLQTGLQGFQGIVDEFRSFLSVVKSIPDKLSDEVVNMAGTIRNKINEYDDVISGRNDPDNVMIVHKDEIDRLRTEHPVLYSRLYKIGQNGQIATQAELRGLFS